MSLSRPIGQYQLFARSIITWAQYVRLGVLFGSRSHERVDKVCRLDGEFTLNGADRIMLIVPRNLVPPELIKSITVSET